MNTQYSVAEGAGSQDIVPTLVFDDGRFTYLRFPGNREVPAVFHVLGDGSETLVNARMEPGGHQPDLPRTHASFGANRHLGVSQCG